MDQTEEIETLIGRIAEQERCHKTRAGLTRRLVRIRVNQLREETMTESPQEERWRVAHQETIESNARWLGYHAENIASAVRSLAALPPFETRAEEEIDKAIQTLRDALTTTVAARAGLLRKRVYLEAAE